ncbi:protein of unknown function [Pararobbsia alpina]
MRTRIALSGCRYAAPPRIPPPKTPPAPHAAASCAVIYAGWPGNRPSAKSLKTQGLTQLGEWQRGPKNLILPSDGCLRLAKGLSMPLAARNGTFESSRARGKAYSAANSALW